MHAMLQVIVVDAIRALCLKYPQKHRVLMNFLSNVLREEVCTCNSRNDMLHGSTPPPVT